MLFARTVTTFHTAVAVQVISAATLHVKVHLGALRAYAGKWCRRGCEPADGTVDWLFHSALAPGKWGSAAYVAGPTVAAAIKLDN